MLVRIKRIIRTESHFQRVNHIGTPRKADITGKGNLFIIVKFPEPVQTVQESFVQQFLADELRISFQAPEYEGPIDKRYGRTARRLFCCKVRQSPAFVYASLNSQ